MVLSTIIPICVICRERSVNPNSGWREKYGGKGSSTNSQPKIPSTCAAMELPRIISASPVLII